MIARTIMFLNAGCFRIMATALFRARERLVHQRTELVNALRAGLYEYGHVVPQGIRQINRIAEILDTSSSDLPDLMCEKCQDLLEQIAEKTDRINDRTVRIKGLAADLRLCTTVDHIGRVPSAAQICSLLKSGSSLFPLSISCITVATYVEENFDVRNLFVGNIII